jgi:ureidoacrylate peracid hydrolase
MMMDRADTNCYIPGGQGLPYFAPSRHETALLVIDMQYACAHPEHGVGQRASSSEREALDWFFARIATVVIPNLRRLLGAFRQAGMPIIYTRIAGQMPDGRDVGWRLRALGFGIPVSSKDAQIIPDVAPLEGEIVLTKTTSDVFLTTPLDSLLRHLGIASLIVGGVVTNGCVESSVRTAGDLGYKVWLVEDACAAHSPTLHEAALRNLRDNWALVRATDDVCEVFNVPVSLPAQRRGD